jgi:uncharacterized Tic20 family protein
MADRYCRECGTAVDPSDRFCSSCGNELETRQEYGSGGGGEQTTQYERQTTTQRQQTAQAQTAETESYGDVYGQDSRQHGDTSLAAITHVTALFAGIIGPLVIYFVTDDQFVKENAANATDWQIMLMLYSLLSIVLLFATSEFVVLFVLFALGIADLGFIVVAAMKAGDGKAWRYPLTPPILR